MTAHAPARFLATALAHPERPAIVSPEGEATSYRELLQLVSNIRQAIATFEEQHYKQAFIGVVTGPEPLHYAALLAILLNESAYVPLSPGNPPQRTQQILEDTELRLVLSTEEFPALNEAAQGMEQPPQLLNIRQLDSAPLLTTPPDTQPNDIAYVLFTSGSTGRPKGVPIYHRNLSAFLETVLEHSGYDFQPSDRFLQMFQLTFDLSVFSYLVPLCCGASFYTVPQDKMVALGCYEVLEDHAITVALMVPSVLAHLQRYFSEIDLPALRLSLFCGEALPQNLTEGWGTCVPNAQIENVYGPTEATIFCLRYVWQPEEAARQAVHGVVPIGHPIAGMQARIANDALELLPPGEVGELLLIGNQVTNHYWQNTPKTKAAFVFLDTPEGRVFAYRTGDLAEINQQGNFIFHGRKDNQVKIEGYRVELGEVEHHARQALGHGQVAVLPETLPSGNTVLRLFYEGEPQQETHLLQQLSQRLPSYMQPKTATPLESLPLNSSGKIDRPALMRQMASTPSATKN